MVGNRGWSRRYPPLGAIIFALALAVFALPSALNLPQANPGQTLEYAPVPGNGSSSQSGNFAGLGLGTGGAAQGSAGDNGTGLAATPPPLSGLGTRPSTKQCVGNPPRQTEDPLAPPCVAFFNGDNGGATYRGVTGHEIRVVVYSDGDFNYTGCNSDNQHPPSPRYYDLWQPPDSSENTCVTRDFRVWQQYFNDRYQTYGRLAHFFVYFSAYTGADGNTPAARRADAAENLSRVQPFAAMLGFDVHGNQNDYMDAVARQGVMYFTSQDFKSNSFYRQYAPQLWGYAPSLEEKADAYAGYVCREIQPFPVRFSGNNDAGKQRVYGLIETTDTSRPELRQFQDLVASKVQGCGVTFKLTKTYPIDGYIAYSGPSSQSYATYAQPGMADFQRQGVTTLVWPAGFENQFSNAAATLGYFPEWITGGDGVSDGYSSTTSQNSQVWSHAVVASTSLLMDKTRVEGPCREAFRSVYPTAADNELGFACGWYDSLRQLFTGIQVAGPRLGPAAMNQGYHAIPRQTSSSPEVPACYYDSGDYTCVKDAIQMWWDPTSPNADAVPSGPTSANTQGCWRVIAGGKRFTAGTWPSEDPWAQRTQSDPCNGFAGARHAYAQQPGTG